MEPPYRGTDGTDGKHHIKSNDLRRDVFGKTPIQTTTDGIGKDLKPLPRKGFPSVYPCLVHTDTDEYRRIHTN